MRRGSSILALGALWVALLLPVAALALDSGHHDGCSCPASACFCDHRSASRAGCSSSLTITAAGCSRRPAGEARLGAALPEGELIAAAKLLPRLSRHTFHPAAPALPAPFALPIEPPPPRA